MVSKRLQVAALVATIIAAGFTVIGAGFGVASYFKSDKPVKVTIESTKPAGSIKDDSAQSALPTRIVQQPLQPIEQPSTQPIQQAVNISNNYFSRPEGTDIPDPTVGCTGINDASLSLQVLPTEDGKSFYSYLINSGSQTAEILHSRHRFIDALESKNQELNSISEFGGSISGVKYWGKILNSGTTIRPCGSELVSSAVSMDSSNSAENARKVINSVATYYCYCSTETGQVSRLEFLPDNIHLSYYGSFSCRKDSCSGYARNVMKRRKK